MARKTYKRRRTRKRATKKRYTRKRYYRKKAKTSTSKLWKYVKKATKSEVKRCDAIYPPNTTFTTAVPTGTYSTLFFPSSRFLYTLAFYNNGATNHSDFASHNPFNYMGSWRFWYPYQLYFGIPKGELVNQRIGDKIFAKYINFKIQFSCRNNDTFPYACALYFVSIKRSVSASYTPDAVMNAIWEGIGNFCRYGHTDEIYAHDIDAEHYEIYKDLMNRSFYQKRRKYLKGIKVRRLHYFNRPRYRIFLPTYDLTSSNNGRLNFNALVTEGQVSNFNQPSVSNNLKLPDSSLVPSNSSGHYEHIQPVIDKQFSVLVPINQEWKYENSGTESGIDEYKYYLIAMSTDYNKNADAVTSGIADTRYYVSGELLYTDK